MRAKKLNQDLSVLLATQALWERAQTFDRDFDEQLSNQFAAKLRPLFYAANAEASDGLPQRLQPGTSLEFVCLRESCPRCGQAELSLSETELCLYGTGKPIIARWKDVAYSKVITATNGFLTEIAVNIIAEIREAPSNRTLTQERSENRRAALALRRQRP